MTPPVSIVIPCYNDGSYLPEAVASAEACDPALREIIIVDDGSTDPGTKTLLAELEARGLRVIHQENRGLSAARNVGMRASRSPYVLPLDSDNRIRPGLVSKGVEILDRDGATGVVYSDRLLFGDASELARPGEFDLRRLLRANYIDAGAMIRREAWEKAGGYDEGPTIKRVTHEDWELWIRIAREGWKFHYLPETLLEYRVRAGSLLHRLTIEDYDELRRYLYVRHLDMYIDAALGLRKGNGFFDVDEVEPMRRELVQSRSRVIAMESSKFWKLRNVWFAIKRALHLPASE